ncbi:potassium transporter 5 [Daucus carota subsp. sativus]|uniref:potassium transporter 5 n=1 Tax=Daucus carota subsp. sativus TaxID=79200 RepID=UPI0007F01E01|nr:PREDICTED: potassium transporter 5-like [Daucus carota subsp. sativus]
MTSTTKPTNQKRLDSFDRESGNLHGRHTIKDGHGLGWVDILRLAFQSIGIVYGDLGTSPLYVFAGTFPDGIKHEDDILGAFSLIFYTITLIPLIKYVFIVLKANDNGDGGTFALYSLICRYAKAGFIPSQEAADSDVSNYELETPNKRLKRASKLKSKLEKSQFCKYVLLFATMLGTCMVIGDGILTPCISVLSAVGGIKQASNKLNEDMIVWISVAVLVALFMVQRFGTDKVGYTFAPILFIWFIFIAFTGLYNFIKHDPSIIKALNPIHIVYYFKRDKKQAWISLGGTVLSITGAEALFADVGHFTVLSIQLSTCSVVFPAIVLQYMGQSSYLRKHKMDAVNAFYKAVPGPLYWPMFVIAVLAAVIASQSLISGTFSIIQQSVSLGCFPRVKIVHTSTKYEGQVYIPEINYLLMFACIAVTLGFRDPGKLGNAYGLAVVSVMVITSSLLLVIMIMIWKTHILLIISYILIIGGLEIMYLSAVLSKFTEGGYLPLVFSIILLAIMYTWNDVYRRKYYYELEHKISTERLKDIALNTNLRRIPGIAVFYSELVQGIPPIFTQYVSNVPVLHSVLVFVSIKSLPISKVLVDERFSFRRVKPEELNMFCCVVRYGYTDIRNEEEPFERLLAERLKAYVQEEFLINKSKQNHLQSNEADSDDISVQIQEDEIENEAIERDLEEVTCDTEMTEVFKKAWYAGLVHFVGENEVIAGKGASLWKRVLINYAYNFLKNNVRQSINKVIDIPQQRMLKVGMTYELL